MLSANKTPLAATPFSSASAKVNLSITMLASLRPLMPRCRRTYAPINPRPGTGHRECRVHFVSVGSPRYVQPALGLRYENIQAAHRHRVAVHTLWQLNGQMPSIIGIHHHRAELLDLLKGLPPSRPSKVLSLAITTGRRVAGPSGR